MIIETPWRLDGTGVVHGTGTFSSKMEDGEDGTAHGGGAFVDRSLLFIPENPLALPSEMRRKEGEREREVRRVRRVRI